MRFLMTSHLSISPTPVGAMTKLGIELPSLTFNFKVILLHLIFFWPNVTKATSLTSPNCLKTFSTSVISVLGKTPLTTSSCHFSHSFLALIMTSWPWGTLNLSPSSNFSASQSAPVSSFMQMKIFFSIISLSKYSTSWDSSSMRFWDSSQSQISSSVGRLGTFGTLKSRLTTLGFLFLRLSLAKISGGSLDPVPPPLSCLPPPPPPPPGRPPPPPPLKVLAAAIWWLLPRWGLASRNT